MSFLVAGTSSDAGKSLITAGLCRAARRRGLDVVPFKAQNMSNNSMVVADGEIGRAQYLQAIAAGVTPSTAMNPVLLKPGSLSSLEYDLIKQHVEVGYEALSRIEMYRDLAEIMRHHHERHDGQGYPAGLKGDAIPRLSRVMAVADAFDAMTTNRIYKPRKSVAEALADLRRLAGSEFDPEIVDAAEATLCNVVPPPVADQLPKTLLEKQRFAYFFNDHLTGLHNAEYLRFISKSGLDSGYHWAGMIMLKHFSHYNSEHGWAAGNQLLAEFSSHLAANWPDVVISRVTGDDFVLLAPVPQNIDSARLKAKSPLRDTPVDIEVREIDLSTERLEGLLRMI